MSPIVFAVAVSLLAACLATLSMGCGKLGVGSSKGGSTSAAATATMSPPADPTPKIRITSPARGSFLATGRVAVEGQVFAVSTSTADVVVSAVVNGAPVTLDADGKFRTFANMTAGLNTIDAVCTDASRKNGSTVIGVHAGEYRPAGLPIPGAAMIRVNDASLDAIAKVGESALWATDWTALFQGLNPILDYGFLWMSVEISINQVRFRDVHIGADAKTGGLAITASIDAPIIDCTVGADLGLGVMVGPYAAVASADSVAITGTLGARVGPDGTVLTSLTNHSTDFRNFQLNVSNGLLDAAVQLLARRAIENALRDFITDALDNKLVPLLDTQLGNYLQQKTPYDVLGKPFEIDVRAETIAFDASGLTIAAAFNARANGGIAVGPAVGKPGSLRTAGAGPSASTQRGFLVSIDDDGMNRVLYSMWAGGIMDVMLDDQFLQQQQLSLPIRLEAGSLSRFIPELVGRVPESAPARVHLHLDLPPCVKITGAPDTAVAQVGEVVIDIDIDRGNGYERLLSAVAQVEVGANVGLTTQGLRVNSFSTPRFRFDLVEEPIVELDDRRLEVLLQVVLQPLVPHLMNSSNVLFIPHLGQLQQVNVEVKADGPALEHLSITGDLLR